MSASLSTDTTSSWKKTHALPEVLSRFWSIPGCEAREFMLYTKLRHKGRALIINHNTLLFNRSPDQLPLTRATLAIHSMRLMSIDIQPLSSYVLEKGVKQENKFFAATQIYI